MAESASLSKPKKGSDGAEAKAKAAPDVASAAGMPAFLGGVAAGGAPMFLQRMEAAPEGPDLDETDGPPAIHDAETIQPKLAVNDPGDAYESEADRVADAVVAADRQPRRGARPPRAGRFAGQPPPGPRAARPRHDRAQVAGVRPGLPRPNAQSQAPPAAPVVQRTCACNVPTPHPDDDMCDDCAAKVQLTPATETGRLGTEAVIQRACASCGVVPSPRADDGAVQRKTMSGPGATGPPEIQRVCTDCASPHKDEDQACTGCGVQRAPDAAAAQSVTAQPANTAPATDAPPTATPAAVSVASGIPARDTPARDAARVLAHPGPGAPLADGVRRRIEPHLGRDLSNVRVHAGPDSHRAATALRARAFTHGRHIWLGPGESAQDLRLIAHEATHTVQQADRPGAPRLIQRKPADHVHPEDAANPKRRMEGEFKDLDTPDPEEEVPAVDASEKSSESGRLKKPASPDVDRPAQEKPKVTSSANQVKTEVEAPTEPAAQDNSGFSLNPCKDRPPPPQAKLAEVAGFTQKANSQPVPQKPKPIKPPPIEVPKNRDGEPVAPDVVSEAQIQLMAGNLNAIRDGAYAMKLKARQERANADRMRANIALVDSHVMAAEYGLGEAHAQVAFRRQVADQADGALKTSEEKADKVAREAPGFQKEAEGAQEESGPVASEAADKVAENKANEPDDADGRAKAREQGGKMTSASSDARAIDDAVGATRQRAVDLQADAAAAKKNNTKAKGHITETRAEADRTEAKLTEMDANAATARTQLEESRAKPDVLTAEADKIDQKADEVILGTDEMAKSIFDVQAAYRSDMARTDGDKTLTREAEREQKKKPEYGKAGYEDRKKVDFNKMLFGGAQLTPEQKAKQREEQLKAERARIARIKALEAKHGKNLDNLGAADKVGIALGYMVDDAFKWVGDIKVPDFGNSPGEALASIGGKLIDVFNPCLPLKGVLGGLSMIASGVLNLADWEQWKKDPLGNALKSAADIATGITVVLGSIVALLGVVAAICGAVIILTWGAMLPALGPVVTWCLSTGATVGGWTIAVGKVALALQALLFIKNLVDAATAETAEELVRESEQMKDDVKQAGNIAMQMGMAKMAQVGGSQQALGRINRINAAGMSGKALGRRVALNHYGKETLQNLGFAAAEGTMGQDLGGVFGAVMLGKGLHGARGAGGAGGAPKGDADAGGGAPKAAGETAGTPAADAAAGAPKAATDAGAPAPKADADVATAPQTTPSKPAPPDAPPPSDPITPSPKMGAPAPAPRGAVPEPSAKLGPDATVPPKVDGEPAPAVKAEGGEPAPAGAAKGEGGEPAAPPPAVEPPLPDAPQVPQQPTPKAKDVPPPPPDPRQLRREGRKAAQSADTQAPAAPADAGTRRPAAEPGAAPSRPADAARAASQREGADQTPAASRPADADTAPHRPTDADAAPSRPADGDTAAPRPADADAAPKPLPEGAGETSTAKPQDADRPPSRPGDVPPADADADLRAKAGPKDGNDLTSAEIAAELAQARERKPQPVTDPELKAKGYVEEIPLDNGHTWRKRKDGTWCRFSNGSSTLCGTGLTPYQQRRNQDVDDPDMAMDRLADQGPPIQRDPPERVQRAEENLRTGNTTPDDEAVILNHAVADARQARQARGGGLEACRIAGACGVMRELTAFLLLSRSTGAAPAQGAKGPGGVKIDFFAPSDLFGAAHVPQRQDRPFYYQGGGRVARAEGLASHQFAVVTFPNGRKYLLDPTVAQFVPPSRVGGERGPLAPLRDDPNLAVPLMRDGFVPLTEGFAETYGRAMGASRADAGQAYPRMTEPAGRAGFTGEAGRDVAGPNNVRFNIPQPHRPATDTKIERSDLGTSRRGGLDPAVDRRIGRDLDRVEPALEQGFDDAAARAGQQRPAQTAAPEPLPRLDAPTAPQRPDDVPTAPARPAADVPTASKRPAADAAPDTSVPARRPADADTPAADRAKARADAAQKDGSALSRAELQAELDFARQQPRRAVTDPEMQRKGYVEEIPLDNGHVWRRHKNGKWCRFSNGANSLCGFGLTPDQMRRNQDAGDPQRAIDRTGEQGPDSRRPDPDALARAERALERGDTTIRDEEAILQNVIADGRSLLRAEGQALSSCGVAGSCGRMRDLTAFLLLGRGAGAGGGGVKIDLMSADGLFRHGISYGRAQDAPQYFGAGGLTQSRTGLASHQFAVVTFPSGRQYLVDTTVAQFVPPRSTPGYDPTARQAPLRDQPDIGLALMRDGYVPLTERTAELYGHQMGATRAERRQAYRRMHNPAGQDVRVFGDAGRNVPARGNVEFDAPDSPYDPFATTPGFVRSDIAGAGGRMEPGARDRILRDLARVEPAYRREDVRHARARGETPPDLSTPPLRAVEPGTAPQFPLRRPASAGPQPPVSRRLIDAEATVVQHQIDNGATRTVGQPDLWARGYRIEVPLPNGHVWRWNRRGYWCRFSATQGGICTPGSASGPDGAPRRVDDTADGTRTDRQMTGQAPARPEPVDQPVQAPAVPAARPTTPAAVPQAALGVSVAQNAASGGGGAPAAPTAGGASPAVPVATAPVQATGPVPNTGPGRWVEAPPSVLDPASRRVLRGHDAPAYDERIAGTGGIQSIKAIDLTGGGIGVTITGEPLPGRLTRRRGALQPGQSRAPDFNAGGRNYLPRMADHGFADPARWQRLHLWGPGFGDEAAAGMFLGTRTMNLQWQNSGIETYIRDLARQVAPLRSQGYKLTVVASAESWGQPTPGGFSTRGGAHVLKRVQYRIVLETPGAAGGPPRTYTTTVGLEAPDPARVNAGGRGDARWSFPNGWLNLFDYLPGPPRGP